MGLGISTPFNDVDILGTGFYAQGEYVWAPTKWFSLRPYAGVIFTSTNDDDIDDALRGSEVSANAFLLGGKTRVAAPIPWVAPYIEIGVGASIGSFETVTPFLSRKVSGLSVHVPFTLGLALGRNNNIDLAFVYYAHPSAEQLSGAFAVGFSFPR